MTEGPRPLELRELKPAGSVTVPLPPSVNNLFPTGRGGKRFRSEEYRAWSRAAGLTLLPQMPALRKAFGGALPLAGAVRVVYELGAFKDKRRRDLFNYEKAASDLLAEHGVIADDSAIAEGVMRWTNEIPQGVMRITVGIL